jgi:galactonate dehydratase
MHMRIEKVEPIFVDRFLLVEITTDNGLVGLGESGAWAFQDAAAGAVRKFAEYLIGKNPLLIEHHWQYMYRWTHFRGSTIMGALSAIDIALWDIAGKHYGAPVHALLGGKVRSKARAYACLFGATREQLFASLKSAKECGYTAVGHLTPFLDIPRHLPYFETHARKIEDAIETVQHCRELAGRDVDLCIEVHRRLAPYEAVQFGRAIEAAYPLFLEDPVTPDNFDEMSYVAERIAIPVATGERMTSLWEFKMLSARQAAQIFRPDVCLAGGISGTRKIAALAEASHIGVAPHNPLSAVSTAASLQIAASSTSFTIQELPLHLWLDTSPENPALGMVQEGVPHHDGAGFLTISDAPGIGVSLRRDAAERFPYQRLNVETRLHVDGSVVDQ